MVERILIVDDEPEVRFVVGKLLELEGFQGAVAASGAAMREVVDREHMDLVILDLGLPDENGLELAKFLRKNIDAGIIMLTGRGAAGDTIAGLQAGADDYIAKPFDEQELLARIQSVLSRAKQSHRTKPGGSVACFNGWRFESGLQRLIDPRGENISLTGVESRLLQVLIEHAGRAVSRDALHREAQGGDYQTSSRSIDVRVGHLRRKLVTGSAKGDLIKSVRGLGYIFTASVEFK